jgi:hypothetical protein
MQNEGDQCFLEVADTPPTRFVVDRQDLEAVLLGIEYELGNSKGYRCRLWREGEEVLVNFGPARILYRSGRIPTAKLRMALEAA